MGGETEGDERPRATFDFVDEFAERPPTITRDQRFTVAELGGRPHDLRDGEHDYLRCVMPSILMALPRITLYTCSSVRPRVCSCAILAVWGHVESECG